MSLAQAEELSDAVVRFRTAGKQTIAWAETFGELGRGTTAYVLATGFSEVWLQPSGSVGLMGAAAAGVFVRGALDRANVEPLFAQRHEYKNAADSLLRSEFTEAHREATERLATSAYEQIVSAVAVGRRLPEERVRELVDRAPIPATEAQQAGLVDHLGYRDAVHGALDHRWVEKPTLLYLSRYRRRCDGLRRALKTRQPAVGLIEAVGAIQTGRSKRGPIGRVAGSETIAAAFRFAVRDERIKAIVFRVNSRGGSYIASDTIWREVCVAREAGKPVVVSMGDVAGSGGYYVAMAANVIVAQPATLTGSIGVLGGKLQTSGLLDRLGVRVEGLAHGRHALMFSSQTGFSDEEWAKLDEWLDLVYDDFTGKVARGRSMTREAVHEVARGRVWTGADAAERGLVDELGGLRLAVEIARERAGLAHDAPLRPALAVSPARRLRRPRNSDDPAALVQVRGWNAELWEWGEHAQLATALGLPAAGPLTMPAGLLR
jgi:protease-4